MLGSHDGVGKTPSSGQPLLRSGTITLWKMLQSQEYEEHTDKDDELEASIHNDRDGICFTLEFTPLLPPAHPNERRRKNAKAKTSTQTLYVNENADISLFLCGIMNSIKTITPAELLYKIIANNLQTMNFELEYTIPCTQFKNVTITRKKDWDEIFKQSASKCQEIVVMREIKVCLQYSAELLIIDIHSTLILRVMMMCHQVMMNRVH